MKADWQAILDSIATSLRTDSFLVTSSLVFVVIFALAIALYLVIKLLVNRAGLSLSATVSLDNQIAQSGGSPADGAPYTRTGRFWDPRRLDQIHSERRANGCADEGRRSTEGADPPGERKRYRFSLSRDQFRVRKLGIA
jgi:hypothetical protein